MIDGKSSQSVVQSAVYSIKWAHNIRGLSDPTDNSFVKNLLETVKRQKTNPVKKKDIVTADQIIALCNKYSESSDILVLRDLAIIVLGFSGFLRFDEIRSLQRTYIKFYESYLSVHLGKSKTDQYRKGDTVVIAQGSTSACPIIILSNYISKGSISLDSDEYLFRAAYSNSGKKP